MGFSSGNRLNGECDNEDKTKRITYGKRISCRSGRATGAAARGPSSRGIFMIFMTRQGFE
jgi:hypothetical protein